MLAADAQGAARPAPGRFRAGLSSTSSAGSAASARAIEQALAAQWQIAGQLEGAVRRGPTRCAGGSPPDAARLLGAVLPQGAAPEAGRPAPIGARQHRIEQVMVRAQLHVLERPGDAARRSGAAAAG